MISTLTDATVALAEPVSLAENALAEIRPERVEPPLRDWVRLFKLLSDETRLRILVLLHERGELHVRALCGLVRQSQPAVSHHLAQLREDGLIECRRAGKHNFYHLVPGHLAALLDRAWAQVPPAERQVRLVNYVLTCLPGPDPA